MYNAKNEEEKVLKYWDDNDCFNKSILNRPEDKNYHFYDGPPFATGLPHYGHIVASLMKDIVPRYWTMKGFRVERKWGWDCHGLPIENIVEKELGLKSKKDIEEIGVEKFNETCRAKVSGYADEWKKVIRRLGRWVDMDNAYWTMDLNYMESVWWVFKELWDKGLIYEGYKSMHICPRCETTLSQQEVAEGYKDIKDLSVTARFKLKQPEELGLSGDVYVLAWTTTPWTLPGNVALAVGEDIEYVVVKDELGGEEIHGNNKFSFVPGTYIFAKNRLKNGLLQKEEYSHMFSDYGEKVLMNNEPVENCDSVIKVIKGKDLVGKKYKPLFPYYEKKEMPNKENIYSIVSADFVTTEDGTGVVHIAPAFGEDDMNLGKEKNLPFLQNVLMNGQFIEEVEDFVGMNVKPIEDTQKTDVEIIKYLAGKNLLFAKEKYEHSYPHCWRCDTPLLNYATSSWFVNVVKIKEKALPLAEKINWSPAHIKEGRFGNWLSGARDWSISRQRFWASVMPIWRCECGEIKVFGSAKDLSDASGQEINDLHKHIIDKVTVPCEKCKKEMHRVPDVLDTWFDSGSMPYAQMHYPFENQEKFENSFPAEYIAEGIDQTRAWFYYLHIIASGIKEKPAFENVVVNGIVLAEDGKKMSKKLKNYPDPTEVLDKYGADAMRYYLSSSPVLMAENLNFSEAGVREVYNKVVNTLSNVFEFYEMYSSSVILNEVSAQGGSALGGKKPENILDKWILAKLQELIFEVEKNMNEYKLVDASRPILDFITDLSQWYVRRSRDRFKGDNVEDKKQAVMTLREVLLTLSKVMAPFTPFIADKIYLALTNGKASVHLTDWVEVNEGWVSEEVIKDMEIAREVVEAGLSLRAESGIKVRQPLSTVVIKGKELSPEFALIVAEELNVKEVKSEKENPEGDNWQIKEIKDFFVALNKEMTNELKKEGLVREIVRTINQSRKDLKLTVSDVVTIEYNTEDEILVEVLNDFAEEIKKQTLSQDLIKNTELTMDSKIDGQAFGLKILL